MNANQKKSVGDALLARMGVTQYEEWLKAQGLPPKGDGPKIVAAAFKLYGPPLGRVQLTNYERERVAKQMTVLGVNVDFMLGILNDIIRESQQKSATPPKPATPKNEFEHTKLKMTLFNAVIESSSPDVNLVNDVVLKANPPYAKKTYSNGYSVEVLKVTLRGGRFRKLAEFSKEYVAANNLESKITSVDFNVRISKGNQTNGVSVTIYENGKIRLSGGYLDVALGKTNTANAKLLPLIEQPETIRKHIVDNYTTKAKFRNRRLEFNNLAGVFKINKRILLPDTLRKYGGGSKNVNYQNDRPPAVLKLKLDGVTVGASFMGVIQMKGMEKPDDVVKKFKLVLDTMTNKFVLGTPIATFNKNAVTYGPARVSKRTNSKPAPEVVRRGTTCPVGRRPEPYSFQGKCKCPKGAKCYVKPNPQGQPCCYRVPKKIAYSQNRVKNVYNKANVKVPQNVKNRFRLNVNNTNRNANVGSGATNVTIVVDPKVGMKINSRQCSRYTKVALVDIAKRLGIVDLRPTAGKDEICDKIQARAQLLGLNKTKEAAGAMAVMVEGKAIFGTGSDLKLGRRRCETYDKKDLLRMGRKAGITGLDASMSKKEICEEFEKYAERKRAERKNRMVRNERERAEKLQRRLNANAKRREEREQKLLNERREEIATRLGLTRNAIRKEIPQLFGKRFMRRYGTFMEPYVESQVSMIANVLKTTPFNMTSQGLPSKRDIDAVKRDAVNRMRTVLEPEFHKLTVLPKNNNIRNNVRRILGPNVSIPPGFINSYRAHIRKRAVERNRTGQFANAKRLEKAKRSWLHLQREFGNLKPRTPTPPRMTNAELRARGVNIEEI